MELTLRTRRSINKETQLVLLILASNAIFYVTVERFSSYPGIEL